MAKTTSTTPTSGSGENSFWIHQDYREILREEWKERSLRNRRYSMGSFARTLGISVSTLSMVFAKKRGISSKRAEVIADKLGFVLDKARFFVDLVEIEEARSTELREAAVKRVETIRRGFVFRSFPLEKFQTIEEWHHLAIFVLSSCEGFRGDPAWIASLLGIDENKAQQALQRLAELEVLSQTDRGWSRSGPFIRVGENIPSESVKKYHSGLIQRGLQALRDQPLEKREFVSALLTIDESRMADAKAELNRFMEKFTQEFSHHGKPQKVFCLGLQFFDVAQITPAAEEKAK